MASFAGAPLSSRSLGRLLMGPGPCNCPQSVLEAMAMPLVGHLDPAFTQLMDDTNAGLSELFGTGNGAGDRYVTFAASGTGSAGMELLAVNLIERGDAVVVGVNGVFGGRICEALEKLGALVTRMEKPFGSGFTPKDVEESIARCVADNKLEANGKKVAAVWFVAAETSTGFRQSQIEEIGHVVRAHSDKTLLMIDCVTALGGGVPLKFRQWGVDAAFSGTQKCLGAPPSLSPITLGPRAIAKFQARTTPVPSWYFDLGKLLAYWLKPDAAAGGKRVYHHTAPISSCFALHEAVRLILEEGQEKVAARYNELGAKLQGELLRRGFKYAVEQADNRLPQLHCVYPPEGTSEVKLRANLMQHESIEIGAGLGPFAGKVVRIGVMGANANAQTIDRLLAALDKWLPESKDLPASNM